MEERYLKNLYCFTEKENEKIHTFNACIIGCGAIGGYVAEMLARVGILNIAGIDYDQFETIDINNETSCHSTNIFEKKALETKKRVFNINPNVYFIPICDKVEKDNAIDLLAGNNIIFDATNDVTIKHILAETCSKLETPLISMNCSQWKGFISTILPYDNTMNNFYKYIVENFDIENLSNFGNSSFVPTLMASISVSEALKVLLEKGNTLNKKVLDIDLLNMNFFIKDL